MNIEEKVIAIITKELRLKPGVVTLDCRFVEDLGTDSLDVVEIVVALEEEFQKAFPDSLHDKLSTVQDLVDELKKIL